jgi:DnaJ domain
MYPALPLQRPAGEAGAASCLPGRDLGGVVEPAMLGSGITWYDVLGVMPGAEARKIRRKYEDKASLLSPDLIWGAPPEVVTAVRRALELLDTAWEVLGDPGSRKRYDEAVGLRRSGGGLGQPGTGIGSAGLAPAGPGITGELPGVDVAGGLGGLAGWLGPRRRRNGPGAVPDVRGLFYQVCLEAATRRGLRVRTVRLTERPMAVDGLVVDQDPRPPATARRGGTLAVQVWHPPARLVALAG